MSRVALLAAAGRSATAKFHELRLKYWNCDLDVVCCFEGSDDIEFFLPHVRRELGLHSERVDFVNCGGKGVVLRLRGWAQDRAWNMARVAFFVDRDLDDFLGQNVPGVQLYITDFYSIESHVTDPGFFDSVWQDSFRLPITDPRRNSWREAYVSGASELASGLFPLFYVALATKVCGGGVEFDRVKLDDCVSISPTGMLSWKRGSKSFSYSDVFVAAVPTRSDIRRARATLSHVDYRLWFRGKFLLWYAMVFFSRMKASLGSRREANRAVVRTHFNSDTAITCLCSRVSAPQTLSEFLEHWSTMIVTGGLVPVGAST
jgi:hypothetical protein